MKKLIVIILLALVLSACNDHSIQTVPAPRGQKLVEVVVFSV